MEAATPSPRGGRAIMENTQHYSSAGASLGCWTEGRHTQVCCQDVGLRDDRGVRPPKNSANVLRPKLSLEGSRDSRGGDEGGKTVLQRRLEVAMFRETRAPWQPPCWPSCLLFSLAPSTAGAVLADQRWNSPENHHYWADLWPPECLLQLRQEHTAA